MRTQEEIENNPRIAKPIIEQIVAGKSMYASTIAMPGWQGSIVWDAISDYEHVSVAPFKKSYTPTWDDMCIIKNAFWREDEEVYQIHPAKRDNVNIKENCLHLWRHKTIALPKEGR